jgi:hypothetical protein
VTHGGRPISSPSVARRTRPRRSRRRVLLWTDPAPWLGLRPIESFLFPARPTLGPRRSKFLAKNKDLRIPTISRPWARVAATSAPRAVWAAPAGWAMRGRPSSLAASARFTIFYYAKSRPCAPNIYQMSTQHLLFPAAVLRVNHHLPILPPHRARSSGGSADGMNVFTIIETFRSNKKRGPHRCGPLWFVGSAVG